MALVTRTYSFSPGTKAKSSEVNTNENTLYTLVNGNLSDANISATALIALSKLALLTVDSIPFAGSDGKLTQNNTNLAWNDTSSILKIIGTLELGHATDTTLSRSAAGKLAVEGVDVVLLSGAQTLTDKQLTTIELGHASDTTLARVSAGLVSVEG